MNYLLITTRRHQEYVQQYSNAEVVEVFGQAGFDALKDGQIVFTPLGSKVIDMTIAARAALSNPTAYRELLA